MTDIHDTADLVSKALRKAWQLGQTYWQQTDSKYPSEWKKADATQATFNQLVEDTRAALTSNSGAQPTPSVPTGWKLVPIDPTRNMLDIMDLGSNMLYRYRALLAAAPEAKP